MNVLKHLKRLFKKDLTKILAPLWDIHSKLDKFIEQTSNEIADNTKKINNLHIANDAKSVSHTVANKIKENIKVLLGNT